MMSSYQIINQIPIDIGTYSFLSLFLDPFSKCFFEFEIGYEVKLWNHNTNQVISFI